MAENTAVNKLFSLLDSKSDNHVKLSRLNALCHFAKYGSIQLRTLSPCVLTAPSISDELRPDLLKINIVSFLIKRTSPQIDKHRRKECLAALIKLAEDGTSSSRCARVSPGLQQVRNNAKENFGGTICQQSNEAACLR